MNSISEVMLRRAIPLFNVLAAALLIASLGEILVAGKDLLIPIALAILFSFALSPVVTGLQRLNLPRAVAVVAALLFALCIVGTLLWAIAGQTSEVASKLPDYQTTISEKIRGFADRFRGNDKVTRALTALQDTLHDVNSLAEPGGGTVKPPVVVVAASGGLISVTGYALPVLQLLGVLAAVFILTGFLLAQREDLRNRLIKLLGPDDIYQTTEAIDEAAKRVGRLLLAQLSVNSAFGAAIALGLYFIGVPNPILWGALAGVLRFVPYVGSLIALGPPLIMAFAFDPTWRPFLETAMLFLIVEPIAGQVVEPLIYGHSSGLSPIAIVIAAAIWAFFWGPIGLILSTPLTICLVVIGRHISRLEFLDTLFGDSPPLLPHEMFYQRMLAGDPREAQLQAKNFLKGRALSTYYDEIALPAIRRAHLDIVRGALKDERSATLTRSALQLVRWLSSAKDYGRRLSRMNAETAAAFLRIRADRDDARLFVDPSQLPMEWRAAAPVAVLHGNHPLDEIAATMLAQVMTKHGLRARVASTDAGSRAGPSEARGVALVCLSFIEPLTTVHLRAAGTMAHRRCPGAKVMLCIWQQTDDQLIASYTGKLRVDRIVTTISDALDAALDFCMATRQRRPHRLLAQEVRRDVVVPGV